MKKRIKALLGSIVVPMLLLTATTLIFLFSKGYRFNFKDGEIERTGVISVKSLPRKASVYIDGLLFGTSPRAFDGLEEGSHTVLVTKEGYYDWEIDLEIEAEQLIPLELALFLKEPEKEVVFPKEDVVSTETKVILLSANEKMTSAVFCALSTPAPTEAGLAYETESPIDPGTEVSDNSDMAENTNTETLLQVWSYQLVRRFWEADASPVLLAVFTPDQLGLDLEDRDSYSISLLPSPNGDFVVFSLSPTEGIGSPKYYFLSTGVINPSPRLLTQLSGAGSIAWNQNSQHLMYMRGKELRSLNVSTLVQTVILEQDTQDLLWTTNESGTAFIVMNDEETTSLLSARPDGTVPTTLLEFSNQDQEVFPGSPSDDNKSTDQTIAHVLRNSIQMRTTPDNTKLILFTEDTIVLYSFANSTLERYPASDPDFISFSPDKTSFLYRNSDGTYCEFWFVIEERDPLHEKGPRILFQESQDEKVNYVIWHSNARVLILSSASNLSSSDSLIALHIENLQTDVLSDLPTNAYFALDGTGKQLLTPCDEYSLCLYTIIE